MPRPRSTLEQGFTIIELLIATAILSVILLMATAVMLNIGNLFYKGFNQSRIQDDVRSITDEMSQQLKFSDPATNINNTLPTSSTPGVLCVGTTRYTYVIGKQISDTPSGSDQIQHVLWQDTLASSSTPCTPVDLTLATPTTGGSELIAPDSRLTAFCVGNYDATKAATTPCSASTDTPFKITIGLAYGDSDLLTDPVANSYSTNTACNGTVGDQFCATATLSTTVDERVGVAANGGGGSGGGGTDTGTGPADTGPDACTDTTLSYVRQHSDIYAAPDTNGAYPFYSKIQDDSADPNIAQITYALSPDGRVQISSLQSPIICVGAQESERSGTHMTNDNIVGRSCMIFSTDQSQYTEPWVQLYLYGSTNNVYDQWVFSSAAASEGNGVINSSHQCADKNNPSNITATVYENQTVFGIGGVTNDGSASRAIGPILVEVNENPAGSATFDPNSPISGISANDSANPSCDSSTSGLYYVSRSSGAVYETDAYCESLTGNAFSAPAEPDEDPYFANLLIACPANPVSKSRAGPCATKAQQFAGQSGNNKPSGQLYIPRFQP